MSKTSKTEQASVFRSVYSRSKIVMYCFWYRLYYSLIATQNTKSVEAILRLCYMDTDNFIVHVKLEDV